MNSKAQVSLEYMLLLAAFFAMLGVVLPVMSESTRSVLAASDIVLAKRISQEVTEQIQLMQFLGNGSVKEMKYSPVKSIIVYSQGNEVFFSAGESSFRAKFSSPQILPKQEFLKTFSLKLEKIGNGVRVIAFGD